MIHKYKLNGFNIVLDVNSGGVHIVDDATYDMLSYIEPPLSDEIPQDVLKALSALYSEEELRDAYHEILTLYHEDVLFSSDDYEKFADMMVSAPIKSMCLHVAHDCNLRCKYCFASTGDFGEGRKLLDAETGKKAIDFLLKHSKGRRNLELDFFGGEPLMNMPVIKEVVEYAPLESILVETDSPYLAPVPNRGKRNSSLNLPYIIEEIARIKQVSAAEVERVTEANARKLFLM